MTSSAPTGRSLAERIVELIPEIVALKFGCRFKFPNGANGVFLNSNEWKRAKFLVEVPLLPPHYDELMWKDMEDVEILGRPITLADVLRAIQKVRPATEGVYAVKDDGEFMHVSVRECHIFPESRWNLAVLDLDGQSEQCKAFISKILGV